MISPPPSWYPGIVSTCPACERKPLPTQALTVALETILGPRWWAVSEIPEACAEVLARLRRDDGREQICDRHAAWHATFARLRIEREVAVRSVPAGGILVLYGEFCSDPKHPQEAMSKEEALLAGSMIVTLARRFVARSPLAAVIEVDDRGRRARVTLQIAGSDPLRSMVIESDRLGRISPVDVVTGLDRAPAG